jgi:hypothetical protein
MTGKGRVLFGISVDIRTGWIASAAILTGFICALLVIAQAPFGFAQGLAILVGVFVVVLAGECVVNIARLDAIAVRPVAAVVLGAIATSLALMGGVLLSGQTAGVVFIAWSLLVAIAAQAVRPWSAPAGRAPVIDLIALAAAAIAVVLWCHKAAGAVSTLEASGRLPLWIDYYIHGAATAKFGDPLAAGRGDISLADVPLTFYHFGFYQLAAAIQTVTGAPGLTIVTAILLPLGLLLAAAGAYVLATELADRRAGVLALAIMLLLPDASRYWLANGFFGFHWHMFATPGAGYGLATAALALAAAAQWQRAGNVRALALSAMLTVALVQFRAHFFLWLAPAMLATFALAQPAARKHWRLLSVAGVVVAVSLMVAAATIEPLQRLWLTSSAVIDYLRFVHTHSGPTHYTGLYAVLTEQLGQVGGIFAGTLLLVPVMLGALTVVYPAALAFAVRARGWQPLDAFPLLLLATGLIVTLVAPRDASGHVSEYQHRPFVLLYMVIAVWTAAYLVQILCRTTLAQPAAVIVGLAGIVGLAAAFSVGAGVDPSTPRFDWSKPLYDVAVNPSLTEVARTIRNNARPGETIAAGPIDAKAKLVDQAIELTSLAGLPVFLARPENQMIEGGIHATTATKRLALLRQIETTTDLAQALERLRANGINWYMWFGKAGPPFDPDRKHAILAEDEAALYRIGRNAPANTR